MNYGISQMNDAIESERKLRGLSYCIQPQNNGSWCSKMHSKTNQQVMYGPDHEILHPLPKLYE
jgi:hypothetical protein